MVKRIFGDIKTAEQIVLTDGKLPQKLLMVLAGKNKSHIKILSETMFGLPLDAKKGQILAFAKDIKALEKKHKGFAKQVEEVIRGLQGKVRESFEISEKDIVEALALSGFKVKKDEPLVAPPEKAKKTEKTVERVKLTSKRLTSAHLAKMAGPNDLFLRQVGGYFSGLPLTIEDGRIVANDDQVEHFTDKDVGFRLRLTSVMSALEGIVLKGGELSDENIDQAVTRAIESHNIILEGVATMSRSGHQIDKKDVFPDDLKDNHLFEPRVTVETCSADETYVPVETLTFTKEGRAIQSVLMSYNRAHVERIQEKTGGVLISVDKTKMIFRGAPEQTSVARSYVVALANMLSEKGFRKKDVVAHALSVVLEEVDESTLPTKIENGKKTNSAVAAKSRLSEYAKFFAKLPILMSGGRTDNQKHYISLLTDNKYPLVLTQGPAGTGKTFLFLQRAMRALCDHYTGAPSANFKKLILSYPIVNVGGKKTGFLPGGVYEKSKPKFRTYYDHLAHILAPVGEDGFVDEKAGNASLDYLLAEEIIKIEMLEDMMGKSYREAMVVLDEAQNAPPEQITSFLTRAETTSRVFVFGDMEQCYLGSKQATAGAERFEVPQNVSIDETGMVSIKKNGRKMPLGFHRDVGAFVMDKAGLQYFRAYNGFAEAVVMYSVSPLVACVMLGHEDIQRSPLAHDVLSIRRGLRVVGDEVTGQSPRGRGCCDVAKILAKRPSAKEGRFGTVIPIHKAG